MSLFITSYHSKMLIGETGNFKLQFIYSIIVANVNKILISVEMYIIYELNSFQKALCKIIYIEDG